MAGPGVHLSALSVKESLQGEDDSEERKGGLQVLQKHYESEELVKEKRTFQKGDRVIVYDTAVGVPVWFKGTVEDLSTDRLWIRLDSARFIWVHPKQCRRLVKPKRLEKWFVVDKRGVIYQNISEDSAKNVAEKWDEKFKDSSPHRVALFREVIKK